MVLVVIFVYSDSFRQFLTTSDLQFPYVNFLWTFQTAVRENLEISSGNTGASAAIFDLFMKERRCVKEKL